MLPEHNSNTDRQRRLYKKIAALEKKKARCLKYSSTPNQCHAYHARLVSRVRGRLKIMNLKRGVRKLKGKIRKRRPAREGLLNEYLNYLNEMPDIKKEKTTPGFAIVSKASDIEHSVDRKCAGSGGEFVDCRCKGLKASLSYLKANIGRCKGDPKCANNVNRYIQNNTGLIKRYCVKKKVTEGGFETKPKGWTEKSVKKSASTLAKGMGLKSAKDKGFFEKCVKKMSKHMENPEGYCASLKDEAYDSTYWRGKDKPKKQAIKMTRMHKNV